jgi:uncharacterized protein (DUF4415 family)
MPRSLDGNNSNGDGADGKGVEAEASSPEKQRVVLELDPEVLRRFKAHGEDWQQVMNDALRDALFKKKDEH